MFSFLLLWSLFHLGVKRFFFFLLSQYCKLAKLRLPGSLSSLEKPGLSFSFASFCSAYVFGFLLILRLPLTRFVIYRGWQWQRGEAGRRSPWGSVPGLATHTMATLSWLTPSPPSYPPAGLCSTPGAVMCNLLAPLQDPLASVHLLWLPFRQELTNSWFLSACSLFSHDSVD